MHFETHTVASKLAILSGVQDEARRLSMFGEAESSSLARNRPNAKILIQKTGVDNYDGAPPAFSSRRQGAGGTLSVQSSTSIVVEFQVEPSG